MSNSKDEQAKANAVDEKETDDGVKENSEIKDEKIAETGNQF